jgi:hypothetical protein
LFLRGLGVSSLRQKADAMLNWGQEVAISEGNRAVTLVVEVQTVVMRSSSDARAREGGHVSDCC